MKFADDFLRSKVTWTGMGAIVYVLIRYSLGKIELDETALSVFTALGMIFGRDAMAKTGTEIVTANQNTADAVAAQPTVVVTQECPSEGEG